MSEWDSWGKLEQFLEKRDVDISFSSYGAVCLREDYHGKIDIYDMKDNNPDYENGCVDVKTEDIKDLFACLWPKRWTKIFQEYEDFEVD